MARPSYNTVALALVPVTFALYTLNELRKGSLYPTLPSFLSASIGALYVVLALAFLYA